MEHAISVTVLDTHAYLLASRATPSGIWREDEPVIVTTLGPHAVAQAIEELYALGPRPMAQEPTSPLNPKDAPTLRATGFRSWKALAAAARSYAVYFTDSAIDVEMTHLDARQRGQFDPARRRTLASSASFLEIAEIIVEDALQQAEQ